MTAANDSTCAGAWKSYRRCPWGDLITGTKAQLQALGLGVGRAFPGEMHGPRRCLNVRDGMGNPVKIEVDFSNDALFVAQRRFLNWPKRPRENWAFFAAGVRVDRRTFGDVFEGTAEALAAAGVCKPGEFPGMPGMRKTKVTILSSGKVADGCPQARVRGARDEGAKQVSGAGKGKYQVAVFVSKSEQEIRWAAEHRFDQEWARRIGSLPRPAMLMPVARSVVMAIDGAIASAASDSAFQAMLARLIDSAGRSPKKDTSV